MRKLALAAAVAMACGGRAQALGLGDIELNSTLNAPLDAEIRLVSDRPGELRSAVVELAPAEAFAQAGVERLALLNDLHFDVQTLADGVAVVKVSSGQSIREPFLDFIVELRWDAGRLLREYTVLLDPPTVSDTPAPAIEPPVPGDSAAAAPAGPPPAKAPAPAAKAAAPAAAAATVVEERRVARLRDRGRRYGPTQLSDTLWSVAERLRPDEGVSVQQMMLALVKANPEAFQGNNVNGLKAGYVLRLPERSLITALSHPEAVREVKRQHAYWKEVGGAEGLKAAQAAVVPAAAAPAGGGQGPRLRLVAPGDGSAGAGGVATELAKLRNELALAMETADVARQENEALRTRVASLESQISALERLVNVNDAGLAAAQQRLAEETDQSTGAGAEEGSVADMPSAVEGAAVREGGLAGAEAPAVPAAQEPAVDAPAADAGTGSTAAAPKPTVDLGGELSEPSLLDGILGNPNMLMTAGGGVLLLLALAALVIRRRRAEAGDAPLAPAPAAPVAEKTESELPAETLSFSEERDEGDSAFGALSGLDEEQVEDELDDATEDLDVMQTSEGEIDPLVEADVYLAYRRFQQAEDLVKAALEKCPDRSELKLKLLEVYYAARNADAFRPLAEEFFEAVGHDPLDAMWMRVQQMGRDLCPDHHLFAEGDTAAPAPAVAAAATSAAAAAGFAGDEAELPSSNFDFETVDEGEAPPAGPGDSLDTGPQMEPAPPASAGQEAEEEEALDFELDFADADEAVAAPPATAQAAAQEGLEQNGAPAAPAEAAETGAAEAGGETSSWDLESSGSSDFGDLDFGLDDTDLLAGTDVVGTKLDLARAYIDMGDQDSARDILDEVLNEGSDEQKAEAKTLVEQIA